MLSGIAHRARLCCLREPKQGLLITLRWNGSCNLTENRSRDAREAVDVGSQAKVGRKASVSENEPDEPSTASVFGALWDALTDLMGSSATATLVRRAAKRATSKRPGLGILTIHRPAFEYEYIVPERWNDDGNGREDLKELMNNLVPLLTELTGSIAIRRLQAVSILVRAGMIQGEATDQREGGES